MIRLLFIVPYPELMEQVKKVLANHPERERLTRMFRHFGRRDAGYSGRMSMMRSLPWLQCQKTLAKYSETIPTIRVHIPVMILSGQIYECRENFHPKKIAVCGFEENLYERQISAGCWGGVRGLRPVLNQELPQILKKAVEDGCDAIVGGYSANVLAKGMGLNSVGDPDWYGSTLPGYDEAIRTVERDPAGTDHSTDV